MSQWTGLPSVGPVLAQNLIQVEIDTPESFWEVGVKGTVLRIRPGVSASTCSGP